MRKRNLLGFIIDQWRTIIIVLGLYFFYWIIFAYQAPVYNYTVKVTFCDNRPTRIIHDYTWRRPGIDNQGHSRYGEVLSKYEFTAHDGKNYTLLNVCELTIVSKQCMGDYSLYSNPY